MDPSWQLVFEEGARRMHGQHSGSQLDRYIPIRDLGAGQYGTAKLYQDRLTGEQVAIKFLKRGRQIANTLAYVNREILNHRRLGSHPFIIQWKEVFLTPEHLAIVMEYAAGGELFDKIATAGQFPEDVARYFFQQLITGVAWCHSQGVCHRDLKLENNLLDRPTPDSALLSYKGLVAAGPRLKICDFGFARCAELDSQPKSMVGTPSYLAPEVLSQRHYNGCLADVWSCGVTLYVMLVGAYPFEDPEDPRNIRKTMERIATGQYTIPPDVRLSRGCRDLLSRILVVDPARRISLDQVQQHAWFIKNLPRELKGGGQALRSSAAPRFSQSDEEIRQLVAAACNPTEESIREDEILLEERLPLSKDTFFDSLCEEFKDAEFMRPPQALKAEPLVVQSLDFKHPSPAANQPPATPAEMEEGPPCRAPQTAGGVPGHLACVPTRPGAMPTTCVMDPDLAFELGEEFGGYY